MILETCFNSSPKNQKLFFAAALDDFESVEAIAAFLVTKAVILPRHLQQRTLNIKNTFVALRQSQNP
jgi:hypothetical protein